MFDLNDIQRTALAALGAIVLSTVSVAAAVGPARVIETSPVSYAQAAAPAQAANV